MVGNDAREVLVDEGKTPTEGTAVGQTPEPVQQEPSTSTEESPYVTREEYNRLLQQNEQILNTVKRTQGATASSLDAIKKEINSLTSQAVNGLKMVGKDPTPEEIQIIQAKARDQVLMGTSELDVPQVGQTPAPQPSQEPDFANDPFFLAANDLASTVEGGLSDKDPEFKMVDYQAKTPGQWLSTVAKAVEAKKQRLASQKERQPEAVTTVSSPGGRKSVSFDETQNPLDILEQAHRKQKR